LLGAHGVPLPTLAHRLAGETAVALNTSPSGAPGAPVLRYGYLSSAADALPFPDLVARIRASRPAAIVLVADVARPTSFEALVKLDLALCAKFGSTAARVWALVDQAAPKRTTRAIMDTSVGTQSYPSCRISVISSDVADALHFLALGARYVRHTFDVKFAAKNVGRELRRMHEVVAGLVLRAGAPCLASVTALGVNDVGVDRVPAVWNWAWPPAQKIFSACVS
jgi:hypothetical protein